MDQGPTNEEMGRGYTRLTDYTQSDDSATSSLYLLITESLPYLVERKEESMEIQRYTNDQKFNLRGELQVD